MMTPKKADLQVEPQFSSRLRPDLLLDRGGVGRSNITRRHPEGLLRGSLKEAAGGQVAGVRLVDMFFVCLLEGGK